MGQLEKTSLHILQSALEELDAGFSSYPPLPAMLIEEERLARVLSEVATRLTDNYPYFHPLYAGQMLKPPHPVARLAYMLSMWINPNNHALDGGRASSAMEKEAVADLARMIGWNTHLGHLCAGGTMANLEALWVGGQLHRGKIIVASDQAHYTHSRISGVLGLSFESIPSDHRGRLNITSLRRRLEKGGIGTVVATIGTTSTGSVDPLPAILDLRREFGFRIHADAAYGGYFGITGNLNGETKRTYDLLSEADSVVIDPHKHGLQPYGCGCVLFKDPGIGRLYKHDSPYTYFSSGDLHLGEISLECSRPGAAAVALWATHKLLPPVHRGEFARGLELGREAAMTLHKKLLADNRFVVPFPPELDIVVWAVRSDRASDSSAIARQIFKEAEKRNLHLALAELPSEFFADNSPVLDNDRPRITCLRSVLMKPEHNDWVGSIWNILQEATDAAMNQE